MDYVLRSIKPYYVYLILTGQKTCEIGKTRFKQHCPATVYIYCSKDMKSFNRIPEEDKAWMKELLGKVVASFVCDNVLKLKNVISGIYNVRECETDVCEGELLASWNHCLTVGEFIDYGKGKDVYAWHIDSLTRFDTPKDVRSFKHCIMPEMPYCQGCKHGYISYHDVECKADLDGAFFDEICLNRVQRPPQSWMYVLKYEE